MKKFKLLLVVIFSGLGSFSQASSLEDFLGTWYGDGTSIQRSPVSFTAQVNQKAQFAIQITLDQDKLLIVECSKNLDRPEQEPKCLKTPYTVKGEGLYWETVKVGDIFPHKLVMFVGNSQVSEAMKFNLSSNKNELSFFYQFSTYDGFLETRQAILKK